MLCYLTITSRKRKEREKERLLALTFLNILHVTYDFETWNDGLYGLQVLSGLENSQANPMDKKVLKVGIAHIILHKLCVPIIGLGLVAFV